MRRETICCDLNICESSIELIYAANDCKNKQTTRGISVFALSMFVSPFRPALEVCIVVNRNALVVCCFVLRCLSVCLSELSVYKICVVGVLCCVVLCLDARLFLGRAFTANEGGGLYLRRDARELLTQPP